MKVVLTTLWGRPKKLAGRGLTTPMGKEAHILSKIALDTAINLEKTGNLAFFLGHGSFRERGFFANKINANLYVVLTLNKYGGGMIGYDIRSKEKSKPFSVRLSYYLKENFGIDYEVEELKGKNNRYGMISFVYPQKVLGMVIALADLKTLNKIFEKDSPKILSDGILYNYEEV